MRCIRQFDLREFDLSLTDFTALVQLVNYATEPANSISIWVTGGFGSARLFAPGSAPVDLPLRRSGGRTEITVPALAAYGAVLCTRAQML